MLQILGVVTVNVREPSRFFLATVFRRLTCKHCI